MPMVSCIFVAPRIAPLVLLRPFRVLHVSQSYKVAWYSFHSSPLAATNITQTDRHHFNLISQTALNRAFRQGRPNAVKGGQSYQSSRTRDELQLSPSVMASPESRDANGHLLATQEARTLELLEGFASIPQIDKAWILSNSKHGVYSE